MTRVSTTLYSTDGSLVILSNDAQPGRRASDYFALSHGAVSDSDQGNAPTSINGGDSGNASGLLPTSEIATGGNISSLNSSLGMPTVGADPFMPYIDATDDKAPASLGPVGIYQTTASQIEQPDNFPHRLDSTHLEHNSGPASVLISTEVVSTVDATANSYDLNLDTYNNTPDAPQYHYSAVLPDTAPHTDPEALAYPNPDLPIASLVQAFPSSGIQLMSQTLNASASLARPTLSTITSATPLPTVSIEYGGQAYVVPLTDDPSQFYIKLAANGQSTSVPIDVAANLFGAEKAVLLLNDLHTMGNIDSVFSAWANVVSSDGEILAQQGAENFLSGISGALISAALSDGASAVAEGTLGAFVSAAEGIAPNLADLALVSKLVSDATSMLSNADATYQNSIHPASAPIDFTTLQNTINDTLLALSIGDVATNAAQNIPGVQNTFWDNLENIFASFVGPLVELATTTGSILNSVATELQQNLLNIGSGLGDALETLSVQSDQNNFFTYLASILNQTISAAAYNPLTAQGLEQSVTQLKNSPYVESNVLSNVYSISPPASITEHSGTVTFTISRADDSQSATVWVSTVHDLGTSNPNEDYYYDGLKNLQVNFAAGYSTASVSFQINDLGLTSGSESFHLIVQQNSTDPSTTFLASDTFTINNTDVPVSTTSYSITPSSPTILESQGSESFTITRSNDSQAATVYVSTVHDQGTQNPNGDYYYNGLLNLAVTFAPGQSTAIIPLTINDLGLAAGSETFRLIVQQYQTDPVSTFLATDNFTITNNDTPPSFSISPHTPFVAENGPPLTFTITRSGPTDASETVYVTTLADKGSSNAGDHWYNDLVAVPVTFAAGYSSATFSIGINDQGATVGSETFSVIVQQHATDPITDFVADTTFTIDNTDTAPQALSGDLTGSNIVSGTETISSVADLTAGASVTVENNATLTITTSGSLESDSNSSDTINNNSGGTIAITTATTVSAPIINNAGSLIVSPGAGNTTTIAGIASFVDNSLVFNSSFNNTGSIQVQSGTLDIYSGGSSSASAFSVASGATLLFTGPSSEPFIISGGTYSIAGNTQVGNANYGGALTFAAGTTVNLGIPWTIDGTVDMSAATLEGSFNGLNIGVDGFGELKLGVNNVGISNLNMNGAVLSDSGTIVLTGHAIASGNFEGGGIVRNEGDLTASVSLVGGELLENDATLTISGGSIGSGDGNGTNTIDNVSSATLNLIGYTELYLPTLDNAGLLYISPGVGAYSRFFTDVNNTGTVQMWSGLTIFGGGGSSNASSFFVAPDATVNFGGSYTFTGGTYNVGGTTEVRGALTFTASTVLSSSIDNSGTMEIASGTLTLDQSVTDSGQIILDPGTTLALAAPVSVSNSISGFLVGATIDLLGTTITSAAINSSEQLVLSDGTALVATLELSGTVPASGSALLIEGDGSGGSDVTVLGSSANVSNGTVCFSDGSQVSIVVGGMNSSSVTLIGTNDVAFVNDGAVSVANGVNASISGSSDIITVGANDIVTLNGGNDTITLIGANDTLNVDGGAVTINGGDGNNYITFSLGQLIAADKIDGGTGADTVVLNSDYTGANALTFNATTMVNVETLLLNAGHSYTLTTNDATVAAGQTLTVDASALAASNSLNFNGAAETDGRFNIVGGAGSDVLTGGAGNDTINGGAGNDMLSGGGGIDTAVYSGSHTDYSVTYNPVTQLVTIVDQRTGSPDGTDTLSNIAELQFADGTFGTDALIAPQTVHNSDGTKTVTTFEGAGTAPWSTEATTFDTQGSLAEQVITNHNGTRWVNAYDTANAASWLWTTTSYDADGHEVSQVGTNDNGSHWLTIYDVANVYKWSNVTIVFDVNWNQTSISGVNDDGSHTVTAADIAAAYDTLLWFTTPYDPNFNSTPVNMVLTGGAGQDVLYGFAGNDTLYGGAGNDILYGGAGNDYINPGTGTDTVNGGDGNDTISFSGGRLIAADHIDGGAGTDEVYLNGDYATTPLVFSATTMVNVENLVMAAGFNYNLTTNDATVASGQNLTVNASVLGSANTLTFNGASETNGTFYIYGGAGTNILTGGADNDTFNMGAAFTAADQINGGAGTDTLILNGNYSAGLTFGATTMTSVETLYLTTGNSYKLTTNDANVAAGQRLVVNGLALAAGNTLTFNGAAETNGTFYIYGGAGTNILTGGAGNDTFSMGAAFAAADQVNGGGGTDTLILNGNYSAGLTFGATTMTNVETLYLTAGNSYKLTTNDANVTSGQTMTVNASALSASNSVTFNGAAETNGKFYIYGGAGTNILIGGAGNDIFSMGAAFTAADQINGGAGTDTLILNGNYSAGLTFGVTTMVNVEALYFDPGNSYKLTTNDATVAAGQNLVVNGTALVAGNTLTFNGAAETNGTFTIYGGAGSNILTGGAGNDTFNMGAAFTATDQVNGGAGTDTLILNGNYSAGLTFGATTMVNVETLSLTTGNSYKLTTNNATVASGQTLTVDASALSTSNSLTFNGAAETNGHFIIKSGLGADNLTGGALSDTFFYGSVADSTSTHYDTINGFNFSQDRFDIPGAAGTITGIDTALTTGALNTATFDSDLATALSGRLNADHAILFTPNSGALSGQTFLIIDANNVAGYQAGSDLVIHLTSATGTLATADFI